MGKTNNLINEINYEQPIEGQKVSGKKSNPYPNCKKILLDHPMLCNSYIKLIF